jgi:signal peptidase
MLSIVLVLTTWSSTGLLGFYPTIVASGSMRPSMDVGDLAIVVETDKKDIVEGDIIQYWNEGEMTLHRVVEIERTKEATYFITKGDANNIPDIVPVLPSQIKGKMLFTIPKIGWVSIYSKTIVFGIWKSIFYNTMSEYTALTIAVVSISFVSIRRIKNNSNRKLSRRGW